MKKFEEIEKNNGQFDLTQVAETFGVIQRRNQFIPGRFYSLNIVSNVPNLTEEIVPQLASGKPYYDLRPCGLVLFHDNWKETTLILNLRTMPIPVSAKLLEAYYEFSAKNGFQNLYRDGKLMPLTERKLIDQRFYLVNTTILSQTIGFSNLNYSINKYNIDDIAEARLIDWDNFGMMVRPRFSQVGLFPDNLSMERVFEEFIANSI